MNSINYCYRASFFTSVYLPPPLPVPSWPARAYEYVVIEEVLVGWSGFTACGEIACAALFVARDAEACSTTSSALVFEASTGSCF